MSIIKITKTYQQQTVIYSCLTPHQKFIKDHIKSIILKSFIGGTGSISLFTSLVLSTSWLPLNRFPLVTAHYHLLQQTFRITLEVQTSLQHLYNMLVSKTFIIKTHASDEVAHNQLSIMVQFSN